jgi:signal transduction histidine kinase
MAFHADQPSAHSRPALAERRRVGYRLHDGLCQDLAAVSFACAVLEQRLGRESPANAPAVRSICDAVLRAMAHAKEIARELDPESGLPDCDEPPRRAKPKRTVSPSEDHDGKQT